MSVTATYSVLGSSGTRTWFALGFVGSSLYGADPSTGIYLLDASTGAETFKRSEQINFRGLSAYNGALASVAYGSYARAFSTSSFTTVSYNWASAYGGAWFDICDAGIYAYAIKYEGGATNQIGKFASDGSVTYGTTANRAYTGIVYLNGYLYASVDGGQVYKIDPTTWAETVLTNSPSLAWRGLTTDGTYLYSANYGGYLYRISPVDGTYEQLLGDSTVRNWQNVAYYNGSVYACIYNGQVWKITLPAKPEVPQASLVTSTINNNTNVTLSCPTAGVTLKYTTDGSTPNLGNGLVYSTAITISKTTTLKFCAINDGGTTAGVDRVYTFACLAPISSLPSGSYDSRQQVTLSSSTTSANLYYTLNGLNPTTSSTLYTGPFYVDGAFTLKILSAKDGCTSSIVTTYSYLRDMAYYYMLPESSSTVFYGLAVSDAGFLFGSASGSGTIYKIDPSLGTHDYWGYEGDKVKLYCKGNHLYLSEYAGYLSDYFINSDGSRGGQSFWYMNFWNWTAAVVNLSTLYAFKDGYLWTGFTLAGNTITKLTTVSKYVTGLVSHANKIYACDTGGIYTINTSTGAYTKLASSVARNWTSICSDGTNLYGVVGSGYVYKIDPTTGTDYQILGDTQTRAWTNVVFYNGALYATVSTGGVYKITLYQTVNSKYAMSSGTWQVISDKWVFNASAWKPIVKMYQGVSGNWTRVL